MAICPQLLRGFFRFCNFQIHLKCLQLETFVKWLVVLNVVCMIMKYVGIHAIHTRQRYYVNGEG